jgi:hypothetical protein
MRKTRNKIVFYTIQKIVHNTPKETIDPHFYVNGKADALKKIKDIEKQADRVRNKALKKGGEYYYLADIYFIDCITLDCALYLGYGWFQDTPALQDNHLSAFAESYCEEMSKGLLQKVINHLMEDEHWNNSILIQHLIEKNKIKVFPQVV